MAASLAVVLLVSGCGSDDGDRPADESQGSIPASSPADPELAAQLPEKIRTSGTLTVGTSAPYEPMVSIDENGKLTGFDIDVLHRVSDVLGLRLDVRQTRFEEILPGVASGAYDVGSRGFFDTLARERRLDMVTYFRGGNQWAQRSGETVDPNNACGHSVAAAKETVQETVELPAKSKACVTVGDKPIKIVPTATQADAVRAVTQGSADAVSADSVVIATAVRRSNGSLETAGEVFDTQPYGFAIVKESPFGDVLKGAVQRVIDRGEMTSIAQKWGLDGVIKTSTVNGATI
ncbi:ABC transporter substrate-binding protein [Gordonia sp. HY002]|uniref:ABC transporter substrate-binding protein n=1 Tax=Gordonia zhenghanii TaxID=2911516 RepID=UPI001EEF9ED5|nr:ABC transporter substrate-binding protein [Gordonia zhenghanii]MCF8569305.1 ABC transporter substrate-binding protein [Gordonia zhenghanii]MCF8606683.1 ABC transporter substrate-binding protein [Gordonia zhenghanii]